MAEELRKSGIGILGDLPWGTHFCHLYDTKQDLIDIIVPYFKTGLEANEFCMWVVGDPLNEEEARIELRRAVPEIDRRLTAGDIEICPESRWFFKSGVFDFAYALESWSKKHDQALARGYVGLRGNGNESWLALRNTQKIADFEARLDELIANKRMIVLCTFPLAVVNSAQLFDLAQRHEFAIVRRRGNWEILGVEKLNQRVEQAVRERTTALAVANRDLTLEIAQRKEAETALRSLSARLLRAKEEERRRLGRDLHDSTAQLLAGIRMNLGIVNNSIQRLDQRAQRSLAESIELTNRCLRETRIFSYLLYPPELDELGLSAALIEYVRGFSERSGIHVDIDLPVGLGRLPLEVERALFRIVQESLTNVHRHSGSSSAAIRLVHSKDEIALEIRDKGHGIQGDPGKGVGIASMQERLREVRGFLDIVSTEEGTTIKAVIPFDSNSHVTRLGSQYRARPQGWP